MRVTSIQLLMQNSKEANVRHALAMLDRCPRSDLILLPEIWTSGFFCFPATVQALTPAASTPGTAPWWIPWET